MEHDLSLTLTAPDGSNARTISGWESIRVTRGIERCPADFDISLTELYPQDAEVLTIAAGDACQVMIGSDLVVTGYIDRYQPSIAAAKHSVRVAGRGKCADLVDCAAVWPGGQISGASPLVIAQQLAAYYGVTVSQDPSIGALPPILQFNLMQGETPWELIERICRWAGLLAYDLPDGNLYLSRAGTAAHVSGLQQGVNVEEASASFSMDQRFSEYVAFIQSFNQLQDFGDGGNQLGIVQDAAVLRPRRRVIIADAAAGGPNIALQRAAWEARRRAGRSTQITVKTDSWRDQAGVLWTPNQLVPIQIPECKVGDMQTPLMWLLSEVTYKRDTSGTSAELLLMPPAAFQVEPTLQIPAWGDIPNFSGRTMP